MLHTQRSRIPELSKGIIYRSVKTVKSSKRECWRYQGLATGGLQHILKLLQEVRAVAIRRGAVTLERGTQLLLKTSSAERKYREWINNQFPIDILLPPIGQTQPEATEQGSPGRYFQLLRAQNRGYKSKELNQKNKQKNQHNSPLSILFFFFFFPFWAAGVTKLLGVSSLSVKSLPGPNCMAEATFQIEFITGGRIGYEFN